MVLRLSDPVEGNGGVGVPGAGAVHRWAAGVESGAGVGASVRGADVAAWLVGLEEVQVAIGGVRCCTVRRAATVCVRPCVTTVAAGRRCSVAGKGGACILLAALHTAA